MEPKIVISKKDFDKLTDDSNRLQELLSELSQQSDKKIFIIYGSEYVDKYWIKNPEENLHIIRLIERLKGCQEELLALKNKRIPFINFFGPRRVIDL